MKYFLCSTDILTPKKMVNVARFVLFFTIFSLLLTRSAGNVPLSDFFSYGVENGDNDLIPGNLDDGSSDELPLSIAFPFFDFLHDSLWVNINGAISFVSAISRFTPICEAVPQNFSMIAPYWCDVDLRWEGKVFYRESFDKTVLQKATKEIINAFPEQKNIQLKWAFLTTWSDVSFFGANNCSNQDRNTFQSVLATDGVQSFAIFFYNSIKFTTGLASNGNCGLGGIPAKAGFDAGDGKNLFTIIGSCSSDIITIADRTNVGITGKWVFRVDNADIESAGCDTNFDGIIRVVPNFIDMYGHVPVEIIGPCFNDSIDLACRFHDPIVGVIETSGERIGNQTDSKVVCIAPFLYAAGRISIDVILSSNETTQIYSGFLYVIPPQDNEERLSVTFDPPSNGDVKMNFHWNPEDFIEFDNLELNLYKYNAEIPRWNLIKSFAENIPNTGSFSIIFSNIGFSESNLDSAFTFSVEPSKSLRTFSKLTNIAKFTANTIYWNIIDIKRWYPEQFCRYWHAHDSGGPNDLIPCPPTKELADVDPQFEADPACMSPPCFFHPGADSCIRSRIPSPSGGGQQCCYKGNNILLGPPGGGTADKCYYKSSFCHFSKDVIPWATCCLGQPNELCHLYYEKRPSDPGTNYIPPRPAGGKGDPHITTFDHLDYTFNGAGEFWLIKNSSEMPMVVQSRMEPFTYPNGTSKYATVFTSFVMRAEDSSTIQVQRSLVRIVDIYVNGFQMDLSNSLLFNVNYENVQVSVASDMSSVSVSFACGFSFLISTSADALSILAMCHERYKNKTRGLLGVYDGNKDNDLQDQNGNVIAVNSSLEDIHYKFGQTWRISQSESLFTYIGKDFSDYNIPNFLPSFQQPDLDLVPQEAKDICGNAVDCLYDYMTTGSLTLANQTKIIANLFNQTAQIYEKKVVTCPPLTYPTNGYYQAENFLPGSTAIYSCYSNNTLVGESFIYCNDTGSWNGSSPVCILITKEGNSGASGIKIGNFHKTVIVFVFIFCFKFF